MRKLSSLILSLALSISLFSQSSPHGDDFKVSCTDCHTTEGWKVDLKTLSFNHNTTKFPLTGQHQTVDCKMCHASLIFTKAGKECVSCHTDMHNQTVGPECARCHTPNSWIVNNITEIHQRSRFPLEGPHRTADCYACHKNASSSMLNFGPLGVECIDCHRANYVSATNPNHVQGRYSTNCLECHSMNSFTWGPNVDHSFFPLQLGHAIDCRLCHTSGSFSKLPTDCISCHLTNFNATKNPNHTALQFSTNCIQCHTTNPGWIPTIYDHSIFALTLGHSNIACNNCHLNGNYTNTSKVCVSCHQTTYNATTNPNHLTLQFPTACEQCHTTNPGWTPATFDHTVFPLTLGHSAVECNTCHLGNYTNTSKECYSCHQSNYTATNNPNHVSLNLSTICTDCHTTNPGWKPAQFTIHDTYFPIYSGKHNIPVWSQCTDCHTNTANYGVFSCIDCHPHNNKTETDNSHSGVGGYAYNSPACYACHPTGSTGGFNHNTVFPLTGAHTTIPCNACHITGYQNTPTVCSACHITAYNQTTNPNHAAINIPNTCATCHTTNPGWNPATFPIHGNYYALTGAHATIANDCNTCHQGNYVNPPNTCVGCHQANYNQTTNPPHAASQFPTTCLDCHNQNAWIPANWNHDGLYFPIYSGHHAGKWNACSDCHTNPANYAIFTCTTSCHLQSSMSNAHQGVAGYSYNSTACYSCHPNGNTPKIMLNKGINKN